MILYSRSLKIPYPFYIEAALYVFDNKVDWTRHLERRLCRDYVVRNTAGHYLACRKDFEGRYTRDPCSRKHKQRREKRLDKLIWLVYIRLPFRSRLLFPALSSRRHHFSSSIISAGIEGIIHQRKQPRARRALASHRFPSTVRAPVPPLRCPPTPTSSQTQHPISIHFPSSPHCDRSQSLLHPGQGFATLPDPA